MFCKNNYDTWFRKKDYNQKSIMIQYLEEMTKILFVLKKWLQFNSLEEQFKCLTFWENDFNLIFSKNE